MRAWEEQKGGRRERGRGREPVSSFRYFLPSPAQCARDQIPRFFLVFASFSCIFLFLFLLTVAREFEQRANSARFANSRANFAGMANFANFANFAGMANFAKLAKRRQRAEGFRR